MTRRTYRYEITGTITLDDVDLRAAVLAEPIHFETQDPTVEQQAADSMEWLEHAHAAAPKKLLEGFLFSNALGMRVKIPGAEHSVPVVNVDPQDA